MSTSSRPPAATTAAAVRLAWEAAELRADPVAQGRHLVDGAAALVGGDFGFACTVGDFVPGRLPHWRFATPGTGRSAALDDYFARTDLPGSILHDPVMDLARGVGRRGVVQVSRLVAGVDPAPYANVLDLMARSGARDSLAGMFRRAEDASAVTGLSVVRAAVRRPYAARDQVALRWLVRELHHLHETGRLDPPPAADVVTPPPPRPVPPLPVPPLPARLRQTLDRLLVGDSAKQVAARLDISLDTAREHIQRLYRRFGVNTRAELLARWVAGPPADR